ncbi:MAG: ribosomal RNA small subunit methyltransferase A [SAR202 cluster bacterium]|nr:ribosomal RNA small subunit methyltransferase A [SAR202 cluster bacterium]
MLTTTTRHKSKALGQHFLVDRRILGRILAAAELGPNDLVLEVGPGRGVLTRLLVEQAARVIAIELDHELAQSLPVRLGYPANLTVVEADARTVDIAALVGPDNPYKVVANLPYYAANPIIRRFLEEGPQPVLLVVMVQREVARSMTAQPGEMSILSVAVQFYATATQVCTVPPAAFRPPPKVTSAVVKLVPRPAPPVSVADPAAFFDLARAGFAAPRKQLRNSLSQGLGVDGQVIGALLESLEIDGRRRPETLSLEEWAQIHWAWKERKEIGSPGLRQD